ncbi:MAG: helix-hairpin-helix domain-containing protein [Planctomycetaceae bacterium]|jgi:competence ComEA-like helix-hairpin-helix protein|nr:helix-hairpin-helix domain-containing protein [Planctomycetaceae bacterium]
MFGFDLRIRDQRTIAVLLAIQTAVFYFSAGQTELPALPCRQYACRIDINAATAGEWQMLPGIGPKLAANIMAYRDRHFPFKAKEELMNVQGIGRKKYEAVKPYLLDPVMLPE